MATEIERKYLVSEPPPDLNNYKSNKILQGYLVITDTLEQRVRQKGKYCYITSKSGTGGTREETEALIPTEQFSTYWEKTEGKRVEKTRYELPYNNLLIELDVYHGHLSGLITAEVEFSSEDRCNQFAPPEWFGAEITLDENYKNRNLAVHGIPSDWKK